MMRLREEKKVQLPAGIEPVTSRSVVRCLASYKAAIACPGNVTTCYAYFPIQTLSVRDPAVNNNVIKAEPVGYNGIKVVSILATNYNWLWSYCQHSLGTEVADFYRTRGSQVRNVNATFVLCRLLQGSNLLNKCRRRTWMLCFESDKSLVQLCL